MRLPKLQNDPARQTLLGLLKENANISKVTRDEIISLHLCLYQSRLMSSVHVLRIVAVLSPMLGLLGTVLGMIRAFNNIAAQSGPVVPATIADGLKTAMLTTAYGLIIALPCLFAAFVFARIAEKRVEKLQYELNAHSLSLDGVKIDL